jgi:hypothetical protein
MIPRALLFAALCTLAAGCGSIGNLCPGCASDVARIGESGYITFEHPFTEAAAEDVAKRAERLCGQRKQIAEKTSSTCSLTKCTTNYYCVDKPRPQAPTSPQPAK